MWTLATLRVNLEELAALLDRIPATTNHSDALAIAADASGALRSILDGLPFAPTGSWLTVAQVATDLNVNPETVRRWIRSGELDASPISNHVRPRHRISRAALAAFLQKRGSGEPD